MLARKYKNVIWFAYSENTYLQIKNLQWQSRMQLISFFFFFFLVLLEFCFIMFYYPGEWMSVDVSPVKFGIKSAINSVLMFWFTFNL